MVSFLNSFSQKSKGFNIEYIDYLRDLFISFILACSTLGEKAFFRNRRFSKTLFESVFVAVCSESFNNRTMLKATIDAKSFEELKNDEIFISFLQSGSSSSENIKGRLERATEILRIIGENCDE